MKTILKFFISIVAIFFAASPGKIFAEASTDYVQTPVAIEAKDVLPADILKGENYTIESQVRNDGLINAYRLTNQLRSAGGGKHCGIAGAHQ